MHSRCAGVPELYDAHDEYVLTLYCFYAVFNLCLIVASLKYDVFVLQVRQKRRDNSVKRDEPHFAAGNLMGRNVIKHSWKHDQRAHRDQTVRG